MDKTIYKGENAAFNYAKQITRHYSKSFYFATRLLPVEKQWATFGLYGFCRYVDNLIDTPRKRDVAQIFDEIECLRKELDLAYKTGESQHPVISAFIAVAIEYNIPHVYPEELLNGVIMDLTISRYKDFDELYTFCYRVAGVVGLMMTFVMGYSHADAFIYAEKLGIAMQLTNILRDIKEDKELDRIYIPVAELESYQITEADVKNERFSPQFKELMEFQVNRTRQYYQDAEPGIKMLDKKSRFAIYSALRIYSDILKKIEVRDYNPFPGRVYVPRLFKIGILLREFVRVQTSF